jgi:hypothetical protein
MQKLLSFCIIAVFMAACSSPKSATTTTATGEGLNKLLDDQSFMFTATQVIPQGSRSRFLTETYWNLTVDKNKVTADLPYFGRATQAMLPSDGGIKFTSEKYSYEKAASKKGWTITIKPEDNSNVQLCSLNVYENGTANLTINSANRQTISYDGTITPVPAKK